MEYCSTIKKGEIIPFAATWTDRERVTLSEVRKGKANIVGYLLDVGSKMWDINELMHKTEADSQTGTTDSCSPRVGAGVLRTYGVGVFD